jgi:acetyltransferase-like isoleucine patch superfamily enzyme
VTLEPAKADPEKVARKVSATPNLKQPPTASYDLLPDGRVANYQMQPIGFKRKARNRIGSVMYNLLITHIPFHFVRQGFLRLFGADIGSNSSIGLGTTILDPEFLTIGDNTAIGPRCLLDARPGLYIGNNVTIAADVHFIGGGHDINHPDFLPVTGDPTVIEDYTWIASRATLISAYVQRGAVVAASAMITKEVGECEIVGGVPAKVIGKRNPDALKYKGGYRPLFG